MSLKDQTYRYDVLKSASGSDGEIRLLTLKPGEFGSPIFGRLQTISLENHPPYEALSYTWGSPLGHRSKGFFDESSGTLILGGIHVCITGNLEAALRRIRQISSERVLWVDALCINQSNDIEKSEQVKAMAKIYKEASRVLAWLGDDCEEDVELAFDTLEGLIWAISELVYKYCADQLGIPTMEINPEHLQVVIVREFKALTQEVGSILSSPFEYLGEAKQRARLIGLMAAIRASECPKPIDWHDLSGAQLAREDEIRRRADAVQAVFLQRSYWSRRWIVQELASAAEVNFLCGRRQVGPGISLINIVRNIRSHKLHPFGRLLDNDLGRLGEEVQRWTNDCSLLPDHGTSQRLSHNLQRNHAKFCSEPKDAIFALLNVSRNIAIEVDYSCSTADTYTKDTREMIDKDGSLNMIGRNVSHLFAARAPPYLELPSWVPHFESFISEQQLTIDQEGDEPFRSGGAIPNFPNEIDLIADIRILQVHGLLCGSIRSISRRFGVREFMKPDSKDFGHFLKAQTEIIYLMKEMQRVSFRIASFGVWPRWRPEVSRPKCLLYKGNQPTPSI